MCERYTWDRNGSITVVDYVISENDEQRKLNKEIGKIISKTVRDD